METVTQNRPPWTLLAAVVQASNDDDDDDDRVIWYQCEVVAHL